MSTGTWLFEQLLVKFRQPRGRRPRQRQQWCLFIKVALPCPELVLQCLLLPRDSNNLSNNPDINSFENMSAVGPTVVKMTSRVCKTLNVGFRSNNTEAHFYMSHLLTWSDWLCDRVPLSFYIGNKCRWAEDMRKWATINSKIKEGNNNMQISAKEASPHERKQKVLFWNN